MSQNIDSEIMARETLARLSGGCEQGKWDQYGYLISNDTRLHAIWPSFTEAQQKTTTDRSGIALCIGQGAIFSLLPHINTKLPVVVDINPAVTHFADIVQDAIVANTSPKDATEQILDAVETAKGGENPLSTPDYVKEQLDAERFNQQGIHWSELGNFGRVQEALMQTPVSTVTTDASSPDFIKGLCDIRKSTGLPITFANFTNITEYRTIHYKLDSNFLHQYPLAKRALVLFSSAKNITPGSEYPSFRFALGSQNFQTALRALGNIDWRKKNYTLSQDLKELVWAEDPKQQVSE